jgi:hypothetical protein
MTVRRLLLTAAGMAGIAAALTVLTPSFPVMAEVLAHPQRSADQAGPDTVVLAAVGLLAWSCWAWGALGLVLTAASALPGVLGRAARAAVRAVLPAGARRSAAVLLGVGLGVAGPVVGIALPVGPASAAVLSTVPDWPSAPSGADVRTGDTVPDWPRDAPSDPGRHVVVRGECLWSIAETRLQQDRGRPPSDGEVAAAVQAWWAANDAVIGPDPDRLFPGQVLLPPGSP